MTVASGSRAAVVGYEVATVRTAFQSGGAVAEINEADCVLTYNGASTRLKTPHRVRIPIHAGAQQEIGLECRAAIGPAVQTSQRFVQPRLAEVSDGTAPDRIFPDTIGAGFK
ncbi:hypothetical protein [Cribrihabitans neustonicus]|uniref:hypothetical protein n=1 Tax=Cribrihabitans neustonicus TaxID=1429085 RepID=UPI003B5BCD18